MNDETIRYESMWLRARIKTLNTQRDKYRKALERIISITDHIQIDDCPREKHIQDIAREALDGDA